MFETITEKAKKKYAEELEYFAEKAEMDAGFILDGVAAMEKINDQSCDRITELETEAIPLRESHKRADRDRVKEIEQEQEAESSKVKNNERYIAGMKNLAQQQRQNAATYRAKAEFIKTNKPHEDVLPKSEDK